MCTQDHSRVEFQVLSINYVWHAEGKKERKPTYCAFSCSFCSYHFFPAVVVVLYDDLVSSLHVCTLYKRKWNVELSITNDFFFLDRRMRNTTNFIKWENDTMEKVFNEGWFKGFWKWKKYSLKYISSIFLCHKNLKFSWLSSCTA